MYRAMILRLVGKSTGFELPREGIEEIEAVVDYDILREIYLAEV